MGGFYTRPQKNGVPGCLDRIELVRDDFDGAPLYREYEWVVYRRAEGQGYDVGLEKCWAQVATSPLDRNVYLVVRALGL